MIPANQRARRGICFPFPRCYQSKIGVGRRGLITDDFNGGPVLKCPSKDSAALKEKIIIYPMIASVNEFVLQILLPVLKDGATLCIVFFVQDFGSASPKPGFGRGRLHSSLLWHGVDIQH